MKLSTKGRYAVMAMADLAGHDAKASGPVPLADIARAAGHFPVLSGTAVRQAAARRAGDQRARTRRRLPPGAAAGRTPHRRHHRGGGRADQGHALPSRQLEGLHRDRRALRHPRSVGGTGPQIQVFLSSVIAGRCGGAARAGPRRSPATTQCRRRDGETADAGADLRHALSRSQRHFAAARPNAAAAMLVALGHWRQSFLGACRAAGQRARSWIEARARRWPRWRARNPRSVIFTSGGTEANGWRLRGAVDGAMDGEASRITRLFVSAIEHDCVLRERAGAGRTRRRAAAGDICR